MHRQSDGGGRNGAQTQVAQPEMQGQASWGSSTDHLYVHTAHNDFVGRGFICGLTSCYKQILCHVALFNQKRPGSKLRELDKAPGLPALLLFLIPLLYLFIK